MKQLGLDVHYNASFHIVHDAQRAGRSVFSKHFLWNLTSMLKYFLRYPTLRLISMSRS